MARRMQQDGVTPPNPQVFSRGFIDTLTKDEPLLTDEEMTQVLQEFGEQYRAKAEAARKEVTAKWDADFAKKPVAADDNNLRTPEDAMRRLDAHLAGGKPPAVRVASHRKLPIDRVDELALELDKRQRDGRILFYELEVTEKK